MTPGLAWSRIKRENALGMVLTSCETKILPFAAARAITARSSSPASPAAFAVAKSIVGSRRFNPLIIGHEDPSRLGSESSSESLLHLIELAVEEWIRFASLFPQGFKLYAISHQVAVDFISM